MAAAAIIALRVASAVQPLRALGTDKPIDLFNLRRRHTSQSPLQHAEYGSASVVPVTEYADFDVRISTAGARASAVSLPTILSRTLESDTP